MGADTTLLVTSGLLLVFGFAEFVVVVAILVMLARHMKFARAWLDLNRQNLALTTKTVQDTDAKIDNIGGLERRNIELVLGMSQALEGLRNFPRTAGGTGGQIP